jgi:hypothetical protein
MSHRVKVSVQFALALLVGAACLSIGSAQVYRPGNGVFHPIVLYSIKSVLTTPRGPRRKD